jgi:flagellin-like hook-associated protein FlgL
VVAADPIAAILAGDYVKVPVLSGMTASESKLLSSFLPLVGHPPGIKLPDAQLFPFLFDPAQARAATFGDIVNPAYPDGAAYDAAIAELSSPGRSSALVAQTVGSGLGRVDALADNLSSARSAAGQALVRIDAIDDRLAQAHVDSQQQRSSAEDLDLVQAISEFQSRQSGYESALKAYATVQRLSLFQYLG